MYRIPNTRTILRANRMRKLAQIIFILLLVTSLHVSATSAHVLKVSNDIGITVHIDPDDAPIANTESQIFVHFENHTKNTDTKDVVSCNCTLRIIKEGQLLFSQPFVVEDSLGHVSYVFPEYGSYVVSIEGIVQQNADQKAFDADFSYYVQQDSFSLEKEIVQSKLLNFFPYLVLLAGIAVILMFAFPGKNR